MAAPGGWRGGIQTRGRLPPGQALLAASVSSRNGLHGGGMHVYQTRTPPLVLTKCLSCGVFTWISWRGSRWGRRHCKRWWSVSSNGAPLRIWLLPFDGLGCTGSGAAVNPVRAQPRSVAHTLSPVPKATPFLTPGRKCFNQRIDRIHFFFFL